MAQYSPLHTTGTPSQPRGSEKSLLQLVRCPVCRKLPTPPVYGCINGHIICENCKEKVPHCSVCRADKFDVRNIVVEEILSGKNLQCPFCDLPGLNGEEMKKHVNECTSRPVECNCKVGKQCMAELVPRDTYKSHMKRYHGLEKSTLKELTIKCQMAAGFVPRSFSAYGKDYLLNSARGENKLFTWIEYLEETAPMVHTEIRLFYNRPLPDPQAHMSRRVELKSKTGISPHPAGVTPEQVLKSGHCLELKTDGNNNENLPPFVWPGLELQPGSVPVWGYYIKVWKPPKEKNSGTLKRRHLGNQIGVPNPTLQALQALLGQGYQPYQPAAPLDVDQDVEEDEEEDRLYYDQQQQLEQLAMYAAWREPAPPQNEENNVVQPAVPNADNANPASASSSANAGQPNAVDGPLVKRTRADLVSDDLDNSDSDADADSVPSVDSDTSDDVHIEAAEAPLF